MFKGVRIVLAIIAVCAVAATSQAQAPCPGYKPPPNNNNLACETVTALRGTAADPNGLSQVGSILGTAMGTQLSQLPIAAAASGSGITIGASGLPTVSTDSLGTILTQRGKTIGKHKFLISFNFQRFVFQNVDGVDMKNLPVVVNFFPSQNNVYLQDTSQIFFRIDQFTTLGTFGLTDKIDVSLIVPFSKVNLDTATTATLYTIAYAGSVPTTASSTLIVPDLYLPGSASGIGDVRVNVKANVLGNESRTSVAIGGEVRFPTGDAANFLGTGAYGFKPYLVISRRGRVTPNVNIGYQWNGKSILNSNQNLPATFLYAGGVDIRAAKRLTFTAEFLGQYVINAPRVAVQTVIVPLIGTQLNTPLPSTKSFIGSYFSDNVAFGFKVNPFGKLVLSASALVKLDDNGMRQRAVVPLFGAAYRF
jgi:hypothetical protein